MTQNASFVRKVVYISIIAVLLIPLSYISQPSTRDDAGGLLAQQRSEYRLAESELGEVDPTSETMKLATLGMRGVATTILWQQANQAKMKENWDGFAATLKQIAKLQPHFTSVWVFQSWNMSYNVSVEFDDYRYRYHWVKKGIDYLIEGTRYNTRDVRLLWHLGWTFGQKIGRSDEQKQFRRMFREDEDFHNALPIDFNTAEVRDYEGLIDNWLVSREFFLRGQQLVDRFDITELGQSPVVFHSDPAMARMKYAAAIEDEGYFGERAGVAWQQAGEEWHEYGARSIPTSFEGISIKLNELEETRRRAEALKEQLNALVSDAHEAIETERLATLTPEERQAYETPEAERTQEQRPLAYTANQKMLIKPEEVAERAPPAIRDKALQLAEQIADLTERARITDSYRSIVNFEYWRARCAAEQTQNMVDARRFIYEARDLHERTKLVQTTNPQTGEVELGAKEMYERAWDNWAKIYEEFPLLMEDPEAEDLVDHIRKYRFVLGQLDQDLPGDFPLVKILEEHDPTLADIVASAGTNVPTTADDPRSATPTPPVPPSSTARPTSAATTEDPRTATPAPPIPPSADAPATTNEDDPRGAIPSPPAPRS